MLCLTYIATRKGMKLKKRSKAFECYMYQRVCTDGALGLFVLFLSFYCNEKSIALFAMIGK
jgi:hypothetical protein